MESEKNDSKANIDPRIIDAIDAGDKNILIDVLQEIQAGDAIKAIGLRFQLRDFWNRQHEALVQIANGKYDDIDMQLRELFTGMDQEIDALSMQTSDAYRNTIVREVESNDSAFEIVARLTRLDAETLDRVETLLPWVQDWRSRIVDSLWSVVQDYREEGLTVGVKAELDQAIAEANKHMTKLSEGAINPGGGR